MMVVEETAHEAEPKGQANMANLSGKQDRDRKESFFSVSFYLL